MNTRHIVARAVGTAGAVATSVTAYSIGYIISSRVPFCGRYVRSAVGTAVDAEGTYVHKQDQS